MERYKIIIQQYCPVLLKNIAIEKILNFDNSEHYECLNRHQCVCDNGDCINRLIATNMNKPDLF